MLMTRDAATLPIVRGALADYLRHRGKKVTALHTPEDWQARAACRGQSAAIFFAPTHFERKDARSARERQAKAVCSACPVRKECLSYALRIREPHGIWGGLSEVERRSITG
jgi:WhiB family redox-sensing transcriptional regulator